jgi:hypothetical protein
VRGMHLERTLKFPSRSVLLYDFMLVPHLAYAIPKLTSTRLCKTQLPYLMRCCHPSCLFQTTPAHHKRQPSTCFRSPRYTFYLKSYRPIPSDETPATFLFDAPFITTAGTDFRVAPLPPLGKQDVLVGHNSPWLAAHGLVPPFRLEEWQVCSRVPRARRVDRKSRSYI